MGLFVRIIGTLLAGVAVLLVIAAFWLQDANNLKPELEALIEQNSDYVARFEGDISWQLLPPLKLNVAGLTLSREDEQIRIDDMQLSMDLTAMWQDMDQWRVTELRINNATRSKAGAASYIESLTIADFGLGQPARFALQGEHVSQPDAEPVAAVAEGVFTYHPATPERGQRIEFNNTEVDTAVASGICTADVIERLQPAAKVPPMRDEDLLPVDTLLNYNLSADCRLSALRLGEETFTQSRVNLTNVAGQANALLDVQDFLGGTLLTDIDIDATRNPITWTVVPDMQGVDSQRLLAWADQRMQWIAPLAFNSTVRMSGNSERELLSSMQAASEFDGGQGQLNIATIKQQLMRIALLIQQTEEIERWPDVWNYQEFTGRWNIKGPVHDLKFAIDNMSVDANGKYDYFEDAMDMLLWVTVHAPPEGSPFRVNPLLEGTRIPVRCTGPSTEPKCRLKEDALQDMISKALIQGDQSGLRRKLEQKIDENVPEEYRETARGILDLLGRSLDKENKE